MLAAILLLLLAIPASLWFLTRLVSRPLRVITQSMEVITAGDLEHRIPPLENTIDDIAAYGRGINMMLDAIRSYKEADFQSRMDATQAKLQYLQLQIRPHFYLNCMKNINSLIDLEQYAKAKSLVYALSSYISHAFSDIKGFITVREELEAIQSYVDLCRALGNEIQLDFKLSGQCMAMDCLPMSLLTFVENSIKHTKSGDCLHLSIRVETFTDHSGEKKIRFLLQDSGGGFSKEALRELERLDPSKMVYRRTHVGIANVRYRLYLGYGEDATLTLRNQGQSAVVESPPPAGSTQKGGFMNLLIVDDQPNVLASLATTIDWGGVGIDEVYTARSALAAKDILLNKTVHILLTDVEMPMENGLKLIKWIRERGLDIECILITSHTDFFYAKQGIDLGVIDYVVQPAKSESVIRAVRNAMAKITSRNDVRQRLQMGYFSDFEINHAAQHFLKTWPENNGPLRQRRCWRKKSSGSTSWGSTAPPRTAAHCF